MTVAHVFLASKHWHPNKKNNKYNTVCKQQKCCNVLIRHIHYRELFSMQKAQAIVARVRYPDGPRACHHDAHGSIELPQLIASAAPRTSLQ
jgi:hypothetical protein